MGKCMDIPSVLFSFLEAAFKRRLRATETEIKEVMSAQLKTHLAVRSSGRENDWLGYACSTLNSQ